MSSHLKFDAKHAWHRQQFPRKREKRYRQPAKVQVYR